jgi:LysR family transcriptional activator of glutamate synthase operon
MDEQTLRIFLSLAETQNTRDTAAELRVNQSNVSRALARLEDEVGMALFARHGKRLELNANGLAFRADAAGVLDAVESARRHAELIADEGRLLRVGFLHSVARWMVPDVIQRFRALRPDVRVSLRQGFARDLYGWLALDTIDVALSTAPLATSATSDDIGWQPLAEEPLCIAVPAGHPLAAASGPVDVRALAGRDFIGFSRIAELRTAVTDILDEADVAVNVTFESSEIDTMRSLVAGGLGVSILPRTPGRDDPGVVYLPLQPQRVRAIGIAWSTTAQGARYAKELVAAPRER